MNVRKFYPFRSLNMYISFGAHRNSEKAAHIKYRILSLTFWYKLIFLNFENKTLHPFGTMVDYGMGHFYNKPLPCLLFFSAMSLPFKPSTKNSRSVRNER